MFAIARLLEHYRTVRHSTLLMNSFYLMFATGVVAIFGFLFWTIIAHSYTASTVGLATTLLSVSGLISLLSLAGFDSTFVRFLPKSNRKNDQINSGLIIVTFTSIVLSVVFALLLPWLEPQLDFVTYNPWYLVSFVFFTAATAVNTITNAVFLAFKKVVYILVINFIFSATKVVLPLAVTGHGAMIIFNFAGVSQVVGLLLSLLVMRQRLGYRFRPKLHWDIVLTVKKYSMTVFISSIVNLLPATLLPLIITKRLGPENAAYFYMAFTISNLLYVVAYASMQSAFAEGSHDETAIRSHIVKAAKLVAALLVPAALITTVLSHFILSIFGRNYAANGQVLLQLFAIGALPVALYTGLGAAFKVTKNLRAMIGMNIIYAAVILGVSYIFSSRFGLVAVGVSWLVGNLAAVAAALLLARQRPTQQTFRKPGKGSVEVT